MRKIKAFRSLALLLALCMIAALFAGCAKKANPLTIWVGVESVDFYTAKMAEYVENYKTKTGEDFPYQIAVQGVDTGSAASKVLDDIDAGADIFTIAHDNLPKLTAGASAIAPVRSQALLNQIKSDNPQAFLDVIDMNVQGTTYTFGIPYIAQSLILMYNTKYLTKDDVKTWEGIWAAAKKHNMQSVSLTGSDGFNNSFLVLAKNETTKKMPTVLYEDGITENCNFTSDEVVAIMQWGQRFFTGANGAKMPTDSGWEIELRDEISLGVITGAWKFNAAKAALGANLGITTLPSFTLTAEDVKGTNVKAGTVYRSGTFADCKVFVMKKGSDKADYLEDILLFLTSKEVQEQSFIECANLPAYKNAVKEFASMQTDNLETELAARQLDMFDYGIPQPFGTPTSQFYYYSKGAPDLIREILENKDGLFGTTDAIRAQLQKVENIWKTGERE
ncbi:MAG TPA: extracellular solute-binding protein [Clostridia bacterium]|mgnify:FL=1|nr:extracellular solute-binding protein [Clostridia bacterium]